MTCARIATLDNTGTSASIAIRCISVVASLTSYFYPVAAFRSAAATGCAATAPSTLHSTRVTAAIAAVGVSIIAPFAALNKAIAADGSADAWGGTITCPSAFYHALAGAPIPIRTVVIVASFERGFGPISGSSSTVISAYHVIPVGDSPILDVWEIPWRPLNLDDRQDYYCSDAKE